MSSYREGHGSNGRDGGKGVRHGNDGRVGGRGGRGGRGGSDGRGGGRDGRDGRDGKGVRPHNGADDLTRLSKSLSYVLRHNAKRLGLNIQTDGYVRLDELVSDLIV